MTSIGNYSLWIMILIIGAVISLLLETAGTPVGFRKLGSKTHIFITTLTTFIGALAVIGSDVASILILISYIVCTFFLYLQMVQINRERGEGFSLLILSAIPLLIACQTHDLVYLAICYISFTQMVIGLMTFRKSRRKTAEACLKLYLTNGFVFLVLCVAIFLALWGTGHTHLESLVYAEQPLVKTAFSLVLIALFTWVGMAPFHWSLIDILDGSPIFAGLLISSSGFIVAGKWILDILSLLYGKQFYLSSLNFIFLGFCALSLILSAISALDQRRIQRLCIYLIFSQPGVILAAALAFGAQCYSLLAPILVNSLISTIGVFAGLYFWKHRTQSDKTWEDFAGAGRKHPFCTLAWLVSLLSLAGIPGTYGFFCKLQVIQQAWQNNQFGLTFLVIGSIPLACIPLVRLSVFLFAKPIKFELLQTHTPRQPAAVLAAGAIILILGIFPGFITQVLH